MPTPCPDGGAPEWWFDSSVVVDGVQTGACKKGNAPGGKGIYCNDGECCSANFSTGECVTVIPPAPTPSPNSTPSPTRAPFTPSPTSVTPQPTSCDERKWYYNGKWCTNDDPGKGTYDTRDGCCSKSGAFQDGVCISCNACAGGNCQTSPPTLSPTSAPWVCLCSICFLFRYKNWADWNVLSYSSSVGLIRQLIDQRTSQPGVREYNICSVCNHYFDTMKHELTDPFLDPFRTVSPTDYPTESPVSQWTSLSTLLYCNLRPLIFSLKRYIPQTFYPTMSPTLSPTLSRSPSENPSTSSMPSFYLLLPTAPTSQPTEKPVWLPIFAKSTKSKAWKTKAAKKGGKGGKGSKWNRNGVKYVQSFNEFTPIGSSGRTSVYAAVGILTLSVFTGFIAM